MTCVMLLVLRWWRWCLGRWAQGGGVDAPEMSVEGIRREAVNGCSSEGNGGVGLVGEGDLDSEPGFGYVTKRETRKS
jgi:hypothetical protein